MDLSINLKGLWLCVAIHLLLWTSFLELVERLKDQRMNERGSSMLQEIPGQARLHFGRDCGDPFLILEHMESLR